MWWYLFVAVLGIWYVKSPKFRVLADVAILIGLIIGLLLMMHTGYMGPFFKAVVSIPIDLVMGLGGLIYHLLLG